MSLHRYKSTRGPIPIPKRLHFFVPVWPIARSARDDKLSFSGRLHAVQGRARVREYTCVAPSRLGMTGSPPPRRPSCHQTSAHGPSMTRTAAVRTSHLSRVAPLDRALR